MPRNNGNNQNEQESIVDQAIKIIDSRGEEDAIEMLDNHLIDLMGSLGASSPKAQYRIGLQVKQVLDELKLKDEGLYKRVLRRPNSARAKDFAVLAGKIEPGQRVNRNTFSSVTRENWKGNTDINDNMHGDNARHAIFTRNDKKEYTDVAAAEFVNALRNLNNKVEGKKEFDDEVLAVGLKLKQELDTLNYYDEDLYKNIADKSEYKEVFERSQILANLSVLVDRANFAKEWFASKYKNKTQTSSELQNVMIGEAAKRYFEDEETDVLIKAALSDLKKINGSGIVANVLRDSMEGTSAIKKSLTIPDNVLMDRIADQEKLRELFTQVRFDITYDKEKGKEDWNYEEAKKVTFSIVEDQNEPADNKVENNNIVNENEPVNNDGDIINENVQEHNEAGNNNNIVKENNLNNSNENVINNNEENVIKQNESNDINNENLKEDKIINENEKENDLNNINVENMEKEPAEKSSDNNIKNDNIENVVNKEEPEKKQSKDINTDSSKKNETTDNIVNENEEKNESKENDQLNELDESDEYNINNENDVTDEKEKVDSNLIFTDEVRREINGLDHVDNEDKLYEMDQINVLDDPQSYKQPEWDEAGLLKLQQLMKSEIITTAELKGQMQGKEAEKEYLLDAFLCLNHGMQSHKVMDQEALEIGLKLGTEIKKFRNEAGQLYTDLWNEYKEILGRSQLLANLAEMMKRGNDAYDKLTEDLDRPEKAEEKKTVIQDFLIGSNANFHYQLRDSKDFQDIRNILQNSPDSTNAFEYFRNKIKLSKGVDDLRKTSAEVLKMQYDTVDKREKQFNRYANSSLDVGWGSYEAYPYAKDILKDSIVDCVLQVKQTEGDEQLAAYNFDWQMKKLNKMFAEQKTITEKARKVGEKIRRELKDLREKDQNLYEMAVKNKFFGPTIKRSQALANVAELADNAEKAYMELDKEDLDLPKNAEEKKRILEDIILGGAADQFYISHEDPIDKVQGFGDAPDSKSVSDMLRKNVLKDSKQLDDYMKLTAAELKDKLEKPIERNIIYGSIMKPKVNKWREQGVPNVERRKSFVLEKPDVIQSAKDDSYVAAKRREMEEARKARDTKRIFDRARNSILDIKRELEAEADADAKKWSEFEDYQAKKREQERKMRNDLRQKKENAGSEKKEVKENQKNKQLKTKTNQNKKENQKNRQQKTENKKIQNKTKQKTKTKNEQKKTAVLK